MTGPYNAPSTISAVAEVWSGGARTVTQVAAALGVSRSKAHAAIRATTAAGVIHPRYRDPLPPLTPPPPIRRVGLMGWFRRGAWARLTTPVELTHHGQVVGCYVPYSRIQPHQSTQGDLEP